ncbi:MAG: hypothetical protein HY074_16855 [Deltaproteobacteria bacterium]|nr:hypothetical protein [Deltaproteobacteria bacterium]
MFYRVYFNGFLAALIVLGLGFLPSARANICRDQAERLLVSAGGSEAARKIENGALAEAVRKLPSDEKAWARQAKIIWSELIENMERAGNAEERRQATVALSVFEHELAVVGKARIDAAVGSIASEENATIIAFPEEPTAYMLLAMSWAPTNPKTIHIKGKTAAQGIAKGFVPVDQSLSKAASSPESLKRYQDEVDQCLSRHEAIAVPLTRAHQFAVIREGAPAWVAEVKAGDQIINILADTSGRPFVSDLDLLAIATRTTGPDPLERDPRVVHEYGDITMVDHQVIRKINKRFQSLDGIDTKKHERERSLVQHGAANRFTGSPKLSAGNFPMTVYRPDGRIEQVENEEALKSLLAELRQHGFVVSTNPRWGWDE